MKNFKAITILLISIFTAGIVFTACEKDDEADDYTLPTITDQVLHVNTGEIAVIKTEDDFTEGSYDATVDDKQTIAKFSNGNLYFLIPEMENGDYILSINYNSDFVDINLKVTKSANIDNPTEYLSNVDTDLKIYFTNNIQNIENELEAGLIEEDLANEQIAYWNAQENRFTEELAKLSTSEKQDFANFLEVNQVWIDELRNYMLEETTNAKNKLTCSEYRTQALKAKTDNRLFAFAWFTLRYKQCKADQAPNPPTSLGQVEYSYSYSPNWMISIWDTYVEPIFENVEQQLNGLNSNMVAESIEDDKNKSITTFANNTPKVLAYHIKFRSVNESDANGPFAHVVGVLNGFINFIDSLADEISNFIGIDVSFTNTSITQSFNRGMTIKNISNANVSLLSSEIVDDKWEVTFKSTGVGEQEFTFDVWYNDGKVEFDKSYDAILTVLEPYSIEILSGNNQSGELGELLEEPIEVLVKDEEGNPFEGALVTFEVSEGSVTFEQNTTNADGIAFTHWELGTNNDEQELIAKAFESDGVTAVQGSPLVFTGTAVDSTLIFQESALGHYRIINYEGNGPDSKLYCDILADGTTTYSVYDDPSWPNGSTFYATWWIVKQANSYYYAESGFWHYGFPNIEVDFPLSYPVTSFEYHNETVYSKE